MNDRQLLDKTKSSSSTMALPNWFIISVTPAIMEGPSPLFISEK